MEINTNSELDDFLNEWNNITPLPQFSDKVKVLKIRYSKQETKLMDIFRAVLQTKEISLRVYILTSIVIDFFPTNYMAWVKRRECIDKVKEIDPQSELNWLDELMVPNQKNYQIWHHRKLLIEKLNDSSHEKRVLDDVFQSEPKNFHAWTHRIWMIRRFNNIEGEFDFIDKMLEQDIKNNSVWNYRFFLVQFVNGNKLDKEIIEKEIKYAIEKIKKNNINECPYCYIRGYINKFKYKFNDFPFIKEELEKIIEKKENENNSFCLMLLLDFYEEEKKEKEFKETIEKLTKIDYIRKKYYSWRLKNFINKNKE